MKQEHIDFLKSLGFIQRRPESFKFENGYFVINFDKDINDQTEAELMKILIQELLDFGNSNYEELVWGRLKKKKFIENKKI